MSGLHLFKALLKLMKYKSTKLTLLSKVSKVKCAWAASKSLNVTKTNNRSVYYLGYLGKRNAPIALQLIV